MSAYLGTEGLFYFYSSADNIEKGFQNSFREVVVEMFCIMKNSCTTRAFCILLPATVGNFCRLLCTLVQLNIQRDHCDHLVHLCVQCKHFLISALQFLVSPLILELLLRYGIFSTRMFALDLISSAKDPIGSLHNLFWEDILLKIYKYLFCIASVYNISPRLKIYLLPETSSTSSETTVCLLVR